MVGVVALWIFAFSKWRVEFDKSERERNRERDNWSDSEKEAFRVAMNRPRS
jgi:hypothetical protein